MPILSLEQGSWVSPYKNNSCQKREKTSYSNSREIDPYVQQVEIGIDIDRQGNGLRTINDTGWFFYWSALKKTKYQTLRKFLHLELF